MEEKREIKKNNIKLGILGCFYNCHEDMDKKLNSWFNRPESSKDFVFSFVSAPFKEYVELGIKQDNTETEKALRFLKDNGLIQYLEVSNKPMTEIEARNTALKHILDEKCDYLYILDGDEFLSDQDVHNILYILNDIDNQFYAWMKINFKNFVFDKNHWVEDFCPPRIFKININEGLRLSTFIEDNGLGYKTKEGGLIDYRQLPNKVISKELVFPNHHSWDDYTRSYNKIKYQEKRGWKCSYIINEEKQCIEFNDEYFKSKNEKPPEVFSL